MKKPHSQDQLGHCPVGLNGRQDKTWTSRYRLRGSKRDEQKLQRPRKPKNKCTICGCERHAEEEHSVTKALADEGGEPPIEYTCKPLLEAFYGGSWWDAEIVKAQEGRFVVHYKGFGSDADEEVPSELLRLRSRKTYIYDCVHFLKPGMDVSVFLLHPSAYEPESGLNRYPAWYDARLISIDRKSPHHGCDCKFTIQFYSARKDDMLDPKRRPLVPGTKVIGIGKIGIMQKPLHSTFKALLIEMDDLQETSPKIRWTQDSDALQKPVFSHELLKIRGTKFQQGPAEDENGNSGSGNSDKQGNDNKGTEEIKLCECGDEKAKPILTMSECSLYRRQGMLDGESTSWEVMSFSADSSTSSGESSLSLSDENLEGISSGESDQSVVCIGTKSSGKVSSFGLLSEANRRKVDRMCKNYKKGQYAEMSSSKSSQGTGGAHHVTSRDSEEGQSCACEVSENESGHETKTKKQSEHKNSEKELNSVQPDSEVSDEHIRGCTAGKNGESLEIVSTTSASTERVSRKRWRSMAGDLNDDNCHDSEHLNKEDVATSKSTRSGQGNVFSNAKRYQESRSKQETDYKQNSEITLSQKKSHQSSPACPVVRNGHRKFGEAEMERLQEGKRLFDAFLEKIPKSALVSGSTSWSRLPLKETAADLNWDPLVFHELEEPEVKRVLHEDPLKELWQDMELAFHDVNQSARSDVIEREAEARKSRQGEIKNFTCRGEHDFLLDEEEGLVCQFCGYVGLGIESMLPVMDFRGKRQRHKAYGRQQEMENSSDEDDELLMQSWFKEVDGTNALIADERECSVWSLIPDLEEKMHQHQKEGFEFVWRNVAGGLGPCRKKSTEQKQTGGCIISHAPGTGKSFLIISFLQSYLKLNPSCRPLIMAPKSMLRQWQREFAKWNTDIAVYILNSPADIRQTKVFLSREESEVVTLASGSKFFIRDFCRITMIKQWYRTSSVLIVSYALFSRLTDEENVSQTPESKKIGRLLLESPGLLILDEGHFPRTHKTKIRKSLMRVSTKLRILLSGTLFQNNFVELFNTFYLVRPNFMDSVSQYIKDAHEGPLISEKSSDGALRKCDLRSLRSSRTMKSTEEAEREARFVQGKSEARDRRLFMDLIGSKFCDGQRRQGKLLEDTLQMLRSMTASFVHCYAGAVLDSLPGLKDFTVMLKTSPMQEELLDQVAKAWDNLNRLELEHIVCTVCIHPSLFCDYPCVEKYKTIDPLGLRKLRKDFKQGAKVRFVSDLVKLCQLTKEKVLIFSQNIPPLEFLEEMLEDTLGLLKGKNVVKLDGKLTVDDRQGIIDRFNLAEGNASVLLASIKACGEGVTLTGASRVVFLDMGWNPALMKQAVSRTFRLGQSRVVYVYRLVAAGTLEENKYRTTVWKDWLSRSIFVSSTDGESKEACPLQQQQQQWHGDGGQGKLLNNGQLLDVAGEDKLLDMLLSSDKQQQQQGGAGGGTSVFVRIEKHDNFLDHEMMMMMMNASSEKEHYWLDDSGAVLLDEEEEEEGGLDYLMEEEDDD